VPGAFNDGTQIVTRPERKAMRLPALIFDFGNVVAFFDYLKACNRLGARLGLGGEEVRMRLLAHGFARTLACLEAGQLSPNDFAASIMARLGLSLPFDDFARDWEDIFWLNQPISRLITSLKSKGYTLILGSNTNSMHAVHFRRQFAATLDQFDAFVLSYEVGCLKPDAGFYEACARAAGVPAASCVFIDDLAENVAGARKAGLESVQYLDDVGLIASLQSLGVEISPGEC
jgi:putative hydrolase of the HAD superfamily